MCACGRVCLRVRARACVRVGARVFVCMHARACAILERDKFDRVLAGIFCRVSYIENDLKILNIFLRQKTPQAVSTC